jgi:hypothetical protein
MRIFLALLPLSFLVACDDKGDDSAGSGTTSTWTEGQLCLESGVFAVDFQGCISSSCDTVQSANCTAALDGTTLSVTAEAVILTVGDECTADCGLVEAGCAVPDGSEGATVSFNGMTATLAEMEAGTCLGEPWL